MRASDQQCEGLTAHLPWRSVLVCRATLESASFAAVCAASNASSSGTILRKMLGWLCCMPGDDHRRRLRQPGERVQNLQQKRVVRRPGRPRRDELQR